MIETLIGQANALHERAARVGPTGALGAAAAISSFLSLHGEELDGARPDLVTMLGADVDRLALFPAPRRSVSGAAAEGFLQGAEGGGRTVLVVAAVVAVVVVLILFRR